MRCPYCRDNIIVQGRFCPKCGEQIFGRPVHHAGAPQVRAPQPPRTVPEASQDVLEIELEQPAEPESPGGDAVGKLCPYCRFPIKSGDEVITCPDCRTPHHADCWRANEGCTTYGCASSPQAAAVRRTSAAAVGVPSPAGSPWSVPVPIGARQLIEDEFNGQCTNALLFTLLQLFFCGGILSIIGLAWSWSLLSQMQRLKIDPGPARSKAIATLVIGGAVMLVWVIVIIVSATGRG